ncbi:DUF4433 domain-containing protein [Microvirga brassicacearum]|uniref:DUF4433 domain-containing protein n=1 Tax=Microvirga brassicacearum TaxID=2580413 RepID=A0A5N3PFJ4_9HYPH|nr:DUF4433 domain-containing protein [Microvirga brassicacearum]KAB0268474.1 DUF4433 domain-containing protein [Microvirga brassicacearum]
MSSNLNPQKALIFRIVHRDNVPFILENGVHCRNSKCHDPNYVNIGNPDLIDKRSGRALPSPPGGTLSDVVPFYFTPYSPMLYNIRTGYAGIVKRANEEIMILVSSLHKLVKEEKPFIFSDRHAYLAAANFYSDIARLDQIDWSILQRRDFKRDVDDPGKVERYQAEALVLNMMPCEALLGVVCYNDLVAAGLKNRISKRGLTLPVHVKPSWYFS